MSKSDLDNRRNALRRKLRQFVECVMAKADEDAAFADQLAEIFLGDAAGERAPQKSDVQQTKQTFNPVLFLKDHGEPALVRELESRTDDDLRGILRFQGLRRGKELKRLERTEMLREITEGARTKLKQGTVVALVQSAEAQDPKRAGMSDGGTTELQEPIGDKVP